MLTDFYIAVLNYGVRHLSTHYLFTQFSHCVHIYIVVLVAHITMAVLYTTSHVSTLIGLLQVYTAHMHAGKILHLSQELQQTSDYH